MCRSEGNHGCHSFTFCLMQYLISMKLCQVGQTNWPLNFQGPTCLHLLSCPHWHHGHITTPNFLLICEFWESNLRSPASMVSTESSSQLQIGMDCYVNQALKPQDNIMLFTQERLILTWPPYKRALMAFGVFLGHCTERHSASGQSMCFCRWPLFQLVFAVHIPLPNLGLLLMVIFRPPVFWRDIVMSGQLGWVLVAEHFSGVVPISGLTCLCGIQLSFLFYPRFRKKYIYLF